MKINKWIQSIARLISASKSIRPTLSWILFKWNKAVSTDSFKLMEVTFYDDNVTNENMKIKNFKHRINEEVLISSEDILEIKLPKQKNKDYNNAFIWNIEENGELSLATTDWKKEIVINTEELNGRFPDYESFFWNDNLVTTWIGVQHMIDILTVYKNNWITSLKMQVWTPLQPIEFKINWWDYNEDIKEIKTILMPIKI